MEISEFLRSVFLEEDFTNSDCIPLEHILIFVGFLIEIVLACAINYTAQLMSSSDAEILQQLFALLITFALTTIIVGIWLAYRYYKEMQNIKNETLKHIEISKNYIEDLNIKDITLKYFSKEIIISSDIFKTGVCTVKHTINLYNHMDQRYDNYVFNISSTESISKPEDYKIFKDGIRIDTTKGLRLNEYTYNNTAINHHCTKPEKGTCSTTETGCKIFVPVGLKPNHESKLEIIESASPSFSKLSKCEESGNKSLEFMGITVNHDIEVLQLSVSLAEDMLDYILERGDEADNDFEHEEFKVMDRSEQRMDNYENMLESRKTIPIYHNNGKKLSWKIYYPKKSYSFLLYFTISKNS